jgi:hypothetical protein
VMSAATIEEANVGLIPTKCSTVTMVRF